VGIEELMATLFAREECNVVTGAHRALTRRVTYEKARRKRGEMDMENNGDIENRPSGSSREPKTR